MRLARRASYCLHFILLAAMCSAATAEKLTIERLFAAPDLSGASLRSPHISPDGHLVAYLRSKDSNKDRLDLWAYDIGRHEHRLLVDSAVLEPQEHALSAEEESRRERQRTSSLSGIVEYEFSADSRYLLVPLGGDLYVYDLQATSDKAVRRLTSGARYETDAHFSPHGAYVSFIRDQNLIVYDLADLHGAADHPGRRRRNQLRHRRVHRPGRNGSLHRLLVVTGRKEHCLHPGR